MVKSTFMRKNLLSSIDDDRTIIGKNLKYIGLNLCSHAGDVRVFELGGGFDSSRLNVDIDVRMLGSEENHCASTMPAPRLIIEGHEMRISAIVRCPTIVTTNEINRVTRETLKCITFIIAGTFIASRCKNSSSNRKLVFVRKSFHSYQTKT
jgi:hypothetical protein